jgi:hypothetical protein
MEAIEQESRGAWAWLEGRTRDLENDVARLRERLIEANQGWSNALDTFERQRDGTGFEAIPLAQLVEAEGFKLVLDPDASERPDILGTPQRDELCAQACKGNIIALRPTLPLRDAFYAVSHEIAECRLDFSGHHQAVWREQCSILSRWCRRLSHANILLAREAGSLREGVAAVVA